MRHQSIFFRDAKGRFFILLDSIARDFALIDFFVRCPGVLVRPLRLENLVYLHFYVR